MEKISIFPLIPNMTLDENLEYAQKQLDFLNKKIKIGGQLTKHEAYTHRMLTEKIDYINWQKKENEGLTQ